MSKNRRNKSRSPARRTGSSSGQPPLTQIHQEQYSGPIPRPDDLARYNEIVPDAAERILSMAESDASHQREIEKLAINTQRDERRRGQWLAFFMGSSALATAAFALYQGLGIAASIIGGTTVVGLVTAFITGHVTKRREN